MYILKEKQNESATSLVKKIQCFYLVYNLKEKLFCCYFQNLKKKNY